MTIANPVKGELAVGAAGGVFRLCYSWPSQRAIGVKFGKPFRRVMAEIGGLEDEQLSFMFWAGFQHHHPDLTEAQSDAIISELGFNKAWALVNESLALAYDIDPAAIADAAEQGVEVADPRKARVGTKAPASSSGSASA